MPHDKIKAAARKRMAETGEKYTTARRKVIEEHAKLKAQQADPEPEVTPLDIPEGAGDFLCALLGPLDAGPSSGPPYTHVYKLPEVDEDQEPEPWIPFTVEKGGR